MDIRFPTEIHLYDDAIEKVVEDVSSKYSSCLVITGGSRTRSAQLYSALTHALHARLGALTIVNGIHSNPRDEEILEAANRAADADPECILSIGGGSVHDAAKIVSVLAKQPHPIEMLTVEQQGYLTIARDVIPVICVPLLVGTGAEVSPASLVRMKEQKRIVFSPHMYPQSTYYSTSHIGTQDMQLNVLTAFDAFVHSLEAFVSRKGNRWADMYAMAGIQNSIEGIMELSRSGGSANTWRQLSHASAQGLLAVANSSVGAIHALSDPLSGIYDIHHGRALALIAPQIIALNYDYCVERYRKVEEIVRSSVVAPATHRLPDLIATFLDNVAPTRRSDIPLIDTSDGGVARLVADSINPDMDGTPRSLSAEEMRSVFISI